MRHFIALLVITFNLAACGSGSSDSTQPAGSQDSQATQAELLTMFSATPLPLSNPPDTRADRDRPDDFSGSQVHVIYAVPAGGTDNRLDVSSTLSNSLGSMNNWLAAQTGGRWIRFDTAGGAPDVTFVSLPGTDAHYELSGVFKRDAIETELKRMGKLSPEKIYAVFYEGGNPRACADAPHPPALPGQVTVWYLQGLSSGPWPCAGNPFAASQTAQPGYREFSLLHELLHTFGAVGSGGPNYFSAHVNHDARDIMYAGSQPWMPSILDAGRSNYYNPAGLPAGVINLANSTFLTPLALPPSLGAPLGRATADRPDDFSGAQVHVIYAVPAGAEDKRFDVSGAVANTFGSMNNWLAGQTSGRWLKLDTAGGAPDVTFVQLRRTDAYYDRWGNRKRDIIDSELADLGLVSPGKIYAVFYEGGNARNCADSPRASPVPDRVSISYLQGTPPGKIPCASNPYAASQTAAPGYQEFLLLHRLLLTLDTVSHDSPDRANIQVSYDPRDVMYAGPLEWVASILDVNKSNYFNPNGLPAGVFNLADSPFLTALPQLPQ